MPDTRQILTASNRTVFVPLVCIRGRNPSFAEKAEACRADPEEPRDRPSADGRGLGGDGCADCACT